MIRNDDFDINEAIVLMFGSYPNLNQSGVEARYGEHYGDVVRKVNSLMKEVMGIKVDWSSHDSLTAGDFMEGVMRNKHPELNAAALECVGNYFAFQMR